MSDDFDAKLDQLCADGKVSVHDADEVRNFASFLTACGPAPKNPGFDRTRFSSAYRDHYPDEYAEAVKAAAVPREASGP